MTIENSYNKYNTKFFDANGSPEIFNWLPLIHHPDNIPQIEKAFAAVLPSKVVKYQRRKIPLDQRRSQFDHSTLIILHLADGSVMAKRHNNNQTLTL